jgi:hypothetical protein
MTKRKTPSDLGSVGARFWRETANLYVFRPDEVRVLHDSCAEMDLIDTLAAAMKDPPLTVRGTMGQEVAHPLLAELRQHRATPASLLKYLQLPELESQLPELESGAVGGGRPRSVQGRTAANARWSRP